MVPIEPPARTRDGIGLVIAHGEFDSCVPHVMRGGVRDTIPRGTHVGVANSGHSPMYEEQEHFDCAPFAWMEGGGLT